MDVLDHDNRSVDEHADRDRDAAQRHDVRAEPLGPHHDEGEQDGHRNRQDRHEGGTEVEQEDQTDHRDDDRLLYQGVRQRLDGAFDQSGPVVGDRDLDVVGHAAGQLGQTLLHPLDRRSGVGAGADDDDAAHRLALAVPVDQAAADLRSDRHVRHVPDQHRHAAGAGRQNDRLQVPQFPHVAAAAHHVLAFGHLDQAAADVRVRLLDRPPHDRQGKTVGPEPDRVHLDLVLAHEAADRRDFGDSFDREQAVLQVPVLERTEFGQGPRPGVQHVHEGPTDAGGVRPELRRDTLRQPALKPRHRLEHPGACPVEVRAVLEDHVDEGEAEERVAADDLGVRHREHRRGDRVGHLVLHDLGRLARELRVEDDLDVGEVGDRVDARRPDGPHTGRYRHDEPGRNQQLVAQRPLDEPVQHRITCRGSRACAGARPRPLVRQRSDPRGSCRGPSHPCRGPHRSSRSCRGLHEPPPALRLR